MYIVYELRFALAMFGIMKYLKIFINTVLPVYMNMKTVSFQVNELPERKYWLFLKQIHLPKVGKYWIFGSKNYYIPSGIFGML